MAALAGPKTPGRPLTDLAALTGLTMSGRPLTDLEALAGPKMPVRPRCVAAGRPGQQARLRRHPGSPQRRQSAAARPRRPARCPPRLRCASQAVGLLHERRGLPARFASAAQRPARAACGVVFHISLHAIGHWPFFLLQRTRHAAIKILISRCLPAHRREYTHLRYIGIGANGACIRRLQRG